MRFSVPYPQEACFEEAQHLRDIFEQHAEFVWRTLRNLGVARTRGARQVAGVPYPLPRFDLSAAHCAVALSDRDHNSRRHAGMIAWLEEPMFGKELLSAAAVASITAILGCSDANVGSSGRPAMAPVGGGATSATAGSGGSHTASGTGGDASARGAGAGGIRGIDAGAGSGGHGSGSGGTGAAGGTAGNEVMADAGGAGAGGVTDRGGSDAGNQLPTSQTCTNAAHVLPMNPQNPQDGITLGGFYVDTDTWNAANYDVSQTMYVCDYDNWYVVANMNNDAHDGAVKTYPNVHKDFNDAPTIGSFNTISSSFAHSGPHVGIYEFAYDIWLNGVASSGSTEVMIWTDNYKQVPSGSSLDTVTYDGRSYDVYRSGSYIAFVDKDNVTSGTIDLLSFFHYVIDKGWIPATSTLGAIDYGVELVSTDGKDATFEVNDFSLVAN